METLTCYNKGCGQKFDSSKNESESCVYHPGIPVFHDALKGWSCCKKRSTDFTQFLNFPGCTKGPHTNEKPKEPVKEQKPDVPDIQEEKPKVEFQKQRDPIKVQERPDLDEPLQTLNMTVTASLQKALDKHMQEMSLEAKTTEDTVNTVKEGTCCKNNGCKSSYKSEESDVEACIYHPGVAIFHEGMKYWSCCRRKTSDFTNFLDQAGCETGKHLWVKQETADTKKSCKMDWFQTSPCVNISVFAKVAVPDQCWVKLNQGRCNIHIVFDGGKSLYEQCLVLRNAIIPDQCVVKMMGTKVEILLKKAEAFSWPSLEYVEDKATNGAEEES